MVPKTKSDGLKVSPSRRRSNYRPGETGTPLICQDQVQACIKILGQNVANYYASRITNGSPLVICSIFYGGMHFGIDLARECGLHSDGGIHGRREYNFHFPVRELGMYINSYDGQTRGKLDFKNALFTPEQIRDQHVLIVDDICESGGTLFLARDYLTKACGYSEETRDELIRTATFIWKRNETVKEITPDWYGFETSSHFLVGYGMDKLQSTCRNMPAIYVCDERKIMEDEPSWARRFDCSNEDFDLLRKPR